jgi:hypothetical protein
MCSYEIIPYIKVDKIHDLNLKNKYISSLKSLSFFSNSTKYDKIQIYSFVKDMHSEQGCQMVHIFASQKSKIGNIFEGPGMENSAI